MYYTKATYKALNEALRKGESTAITENPLLTSDQCKKIIELDDVIENYELERPIRVYRALGIGIIDKFFESQDKIFPEYAYSSTSCSKKASILYQPNTDLLIIDLPKGKGIGAYISDYSAYPKQYEFIIKRGVKFKINEAYEKEMYMWENGIRKLKKRRVFELIFLDD